MQAPTPRRRKTVAPKVKGPQRDALGRKLKQKRDYSARPNLRALIAAQRDLTELGNVCKMIAAMNARGQISSGTLRKLQRAVDVRKVELEGRVIVTPLEHAMRQQRQGVERKTEGGLVLP